MASSPGLNFGNDGSRRQGMGDNNQRIRIGMSNMDPFAKRMKRGKKVVLMKDRAARIKHMQQKKKEDERYNRERQENNVQLNNRKDKTLLGLYVMNGEMSIEQYSMLAGTGIKKVEIGDVEYSLVEMTGRSARLKPLFTHTAEYNFSFNKTKYDFPEFSSIDYKISMRGGDEEKFGSISIFFKPETPRIIVRGGYFDCTDANDFKGYYSQPRNLLEALFKIKGKNPGTLGPLKRANTVASLRTGKKFDYKKFIKNKPQVNGELNIKNKGPTQVRIKLDGDHLMSITNNGIIQVAFKNNASKVEVKRIMAKVQSIRKSLADYFGGAVAAPIIKSKAATRIAGAPAPNVSRRGTTCPPGKRPDPYSYTGKCPEGTYIRPNPQKQPCCYKIPAQKGYYRSKLYNVYRNAGVKMPNSVAKIFSLNKNNTTRGVNVANKNIGNAITKTMARVRQANGKMKNVQTIKIGSRQCIRFSKQQLMDYVLRTGYANTGLSKKSKQELCDILTKLTRNKNINKTNAKYVPSIGTKLLTKSGTGALMIGSKSCMSHSKIELQGLCSKAGIKSTGMTRADMCAAIESMRNTKQNTLNNKKMEAHIKIRKAAKKRANDQKNVKNKTRNDRLYSEFITKIQGFLKKYKMLDANNTVPNQATFMNHFHQSVEGEFAKNITNTTKKGWRAGFHRWLDEYILQYKSVYEPRFINEKNRQNAQKLENLRKKREANDIKKRKEALGKFNAEVAKKELKKRLRPIIDKNLQSAFDARINTFANKYSAFVQNGNLNGMNGRISAFVNYEKSQNGNVRKYLENVVAKLKPVKIGNNKVQRYELSRNFKLRKGAVRELL